MKRACMLLVASLCGSAMAPTAMAAEDVTWLGCRIGPVPKSLDAHLGLDGRGVMVVNVVKDSPADKAGLARYDVITKLGPDPVDSSGDLVERIRKHRPGDKVTMHLIRKGHEKKVEVTLAPRPETDAQEYKYERWPDALLDDRIGVRSRIFRRGPEGWIIEDLDELEDIPCLFDDVLPRFRHRQGRIWLDSDEGAIKKFQARVSRDGRVIEVRGDVDGPITVRRTSREGDTEKVQEQTYKTPGDLRKGDPEAHEIYLDATGHHRRHRHGKGGPHRRPLLRHRRFEGRDTVDRYRKQLRDLFDRFPGLDDLPSRQRLSELFDQKTKEWRERLDRELDAAKKRIGELEEQIRAQLEQLRRDEARGPATAPHAKGRSEPTTRFEVATDGKITVHLRQGNTELTLEFKGVDELKAKRPDLFKKYESLNKKG